MPTKHTTRSSIADEVPGVEYEDFDGSGFAEGYGVRTREREFTKDELIAIHDYLAEGLFLSRRLGEDTTRPTAYDSIRRLMDDAGYDGFGTKQQDGNPLRARELLTVLTGCKDANENLRWADGGEGE